jgi:hypothetical protein
MTPRTPGLRNDAVIHEQLPSRRRRASDRFEPLGRQPVEPPESTLPHVEGQRREGGWAGVGAACFRRPEQEDSKSNSSRTPGHSRALSHMRTGSPKPRRSPA